MAGDHAVEARWARPDAPRGISEGVGAGPVKGEAVVVECVRGFTVGGQFIELARKDVLRDQVEGCEPVGLWAGGAWW